MKSLLSRSVILVFGLLIAPAIFLVLILTLVNKQNDFAAAERLRQAEAVRTFILESRRPTLNEYALWDDFYRHVVHTLDIEWFDENVGSGMGAAEGRSATILLDSDGRPLAGSWGDDATVWSPRKFFGQTSFETFFHHVRDEQHGEGTMGFLSTSDGFAIVAMARIKPHTDAITVESGDDVRYLMFVELLNDVVIESLRETLNWSALIAGTKVPEGFQSLALADVSGVTVGTLAWPEPRPGQAALVAAAPALAAGFLVMVLSILLVHNRIARSHRELVAAESEAQYAARHDPLTGLPNRRGISQVTEEDIAAAPCFVLVIDLDGFKEVNDRLGHGAGDALLIEAGRRITEIMPSGTLVARIGGDEFAIFCRGAAGLGKALGEKLVLSLGTQFIFNGQTMTVAASVGLAAAGRDRRSGQQRTTDVIAGAEDATTITELLRRGDAAMYEAKRTKSDSVGLWDSVLDDTRTDDLQMAEEIRQGLKRDEFWVALQPLYDVRAGEIRGFEALTRWTHPTFGRVGPDRFIPVAERNRLIHDLGLAVLRKACLKVRDLGLQITLSVNLSPVQMLDVHLAEKIQSVLDEVGFPSNRLELEITEGHLIDQEERALDTLRQLKNSGIRIVLDDFGAGFASLAHLNRFPFDKLKIDKSYIDHIATSPAAYQIMAAITTIGKAHGLAVTAEGVEDAEQVRLLAETGVTVLQGYFIGKPLAEPILETESMNALFASNTKAHGKHLRVASGGSDGAADAGPGPERAAS